MTTMDVSFNTIDMYNTLYTRDELDRISQLTETIDGVTTRYDYSYDSAGRLEEVKTDSYHPFPSCDTAKTASQKNSDVDVDL